MNSLQGRKQLVLLTTIIIVIVGLLPDAAIAAITDATLKTAWDKSKLQDLLTKDLRSLGCLIGGAYAFIMLMFSNGPKKEVILSTGGLIAGSGFLMDYLTSKAGALI